MTIRQQAVRHCAKTRRGNGQEYLVACLLCASVSAFAAYRYVAGKPGGDPTPRTEVLLAMRDIRQGEPLSLTGEGANVMFVAWPKDVVPHGAVRAREELEKNRWRARTGIVKHEVIQTTRLVPESEYIPDDMYLQMVKVPEEDLKSGRLRLGMKVDVLRVTDKQPVEFMRCVEIAAIGRLNEHGLPLPEKNPPPNVWLLVYKQDRSAIVEAEFNSRLLLVEAADSSCDRPMLVQQPSSEEVRKQQAQALIAQAKTLEAAHQYAQALDVLNQVLVDYGDLATVAAEATTAANRCRDLAANDLYERARLALESDKDYAEALRLLDQLENDYPRATDTREKARALRKKAEVELEEYRQKVRYQATIEELDAALKDGRLSLAEEKLEELRALFVEGVTPPNGAAAEQVFNDYSRRVKTAQSNFQILKQAMELFLTRGDLVSAREKLDQIRQKYPANPELTELERKVKDAETGA